MESLINALRESSNSWYNDLTITFSGYNIKDRLSKTILSFLKMYPELKNNILVFHDDSTDGTIEWLNQTGIKHTSWIKYRALAKDVEFKSTTMYCSLIVMELIDQIKTKYVFISDGDIDFHGRFLERIKYLKEYYPLIGCMAQEELTTPLLSNTLNNKINLAVDIEMMFYYRVWQGHIFIDLDYYKKNNLQYDSLDISYYINNSSIDSGAYLMYQLFERSIPFMNIEVFDTDTKMMKSAYRTKNNIFEHIGYVSCDVKYGGVDMCN